ncbi:MAG: hypothetical protein ACO3XO_05215 [Bdellovibrionota bacterium]
MVEEVDRKREWAQKNTFFIRIARLIFSPHRAWQEIAQSQSKNDDFLKLYAPALLLGTIGATAGVFLYGVYLPVPDQVTGEFVVRHIYVEPGEFVLQQLFLVAGYLVLPFLLAKPLGFFVRTFRGVSRDEEGFLTPTRQLIQCGLAPAFFSMMFQIAPIVSLITFIVFLQSFYIVFSGITPMLGLSGRQKISFFIVSLVALFFYVMGVQWVRGEIFGYDLFLEAIDGAHVTSAA